MIPPAAAPPSAPMPAPFSRVVNGVEQPRKLVTKTIGAKYVSADFLITLVSYCGLPASVVMILRSSNFSVPLSKGRFVQALPYIECVFSLTKPAQKSCQSFFEPDL